jgi:NADPH:quinone reductase-like Zn-dependent oxidoreductase
MVRSLGADQVIDYKKQDYTADDPRYDLILDNVGNRSLSENRRVLKPEGKYILIGGGGPDDHRWIGPLGKVAHAYLASKFADQDLGMFLSSMKKEDLATLARLIGSGAVTPVIDRRYPMSELPLAIRYLEEGHARGKVVIVME